MMLWTSVWKFLCRWVFSVFLRTYIGVELLSHMTTLTFWETSRLFSKVAADFTFPPAETEGCNFSARLAAAPEPSERVWSHPTGCEVTSGSLCFRLCFLTSGTGHLYTCLSAVSSSQKSLFRSFVFFLNVAWCFKLLSCESYLDVLNTGPPPDASSAGVSTAFSVVSSFSWRHHLQHKCGDFCVRPAILLWLAVTPKTLSNPAWTPRFPGGVCLGYVSAELKSQGHSLFSCNRARKAGFSPLWTGRRVSF